MASRSERRNDGGPGRADQSEGGGEQAGLRVANIALTETCPELGFRPIDGFYFEVRSGYNSVGIWLYAKQQNKRCWKWELSGYPFKPRDPRQKHEATLKATRLKPLAAAMTLYLNSGGSLPDLQEIFAPLLEQRVGLVLPEGWEPLELQYELPEDPMIAFVNEQTSQVVVWNEHEWMEVMPISEYRKYVMQGMEEHSEDS